MGEDDRHARAPQPQEPFSEEMTAPDDADQTPHSSAAPGANLDDRNRADLRDAGDLGAATPPSVDIHDLGQEDNPMEDWGESAEGVLHSANHSRRPIKTEGDRGQGRKTRLANKDIFNRRGS